MDTRRLTDERINELAKPLGDNCWGVTEREGNEMARELKSLRADAAELASELHDMTQLMRWWAPKDGVKRDETALELLSRPTVVELRKEKD